MFLRVTTTTTTTMTIGGDVVREGSGHFLGAFVWRSIGGLCLQGDLFLDLDTLRL